MWKKIKAFLKGKRFRVIYTLSITSYVNGKIYNYVTIANSLKEAQLYMNGDYESALCQMEANVEDGMVLHKYIDTWSAGMYCKDIDTQYRWVISERGVEL